MDVSKDDVYIYISLQMAMLTGKMMITNWVFGVPCVQTCLYRYMIWTLFEMMFHGCVGLQHVRDHLPALYDDPSLF
jgi:hypothetical protein